MYKVQNKLAPARIQNLFTHVSCQIISIPTTPDDQQLPTNFVSCLLVLNN